MRALIGRRSRRFVIITAALFAVAGGIAYATIPNAAGVYTACKLNALGTIRLIDPSLPSTSLLQHCTSLETQITWNQQGVPGAAGTNGTNGKDGVNGLAGTNGTNGAPCLPSIPACVGPTGPAGAAGKDGTNGTDGKNGTNGIDGTSVTTQTLAVGDVNCTYGGVAVTRDPGPSQYVCNGAPGTNGTNGAPGTTLTSLSQLDGIACTASGGTAGTITTSVSSTNAVSIVCSPNSSGGGGGCTPISHANGLGGNYQDCAPLGTFNITTAQEAASSWGATVLPGTFTCVTGANTWLAIAAIRSGQTATWAYTGPAAGHVSLSTSGGDPQGLNAVCPLTSDPIWN